METENNIQVFDNDQFGFVRTVIKDGEPWFVAVDVCRALDIDATATRRLDEDEKSALRLTQTSSNGTEQGRDVTVISESGRCAMSWHRGMSTGMCMMFWQRSERFDNSNVIKGH